MDDEKRAARQWAKFDIGDSETVAGKDGDILDPPSKLGASVPPVPSELVNRRPRLWMFDCGLHAKGESDILPSAPTPKRDREERESLDSNDDQLEQPGVGKRIHVDSSVKIANQFYAPSPLHCMKKRSPRTLRLTSRSTRMMASPSQWSCWRQN